MTVTQLVLQHSQQVSNDVQTICQQTNSLVHFQITSHSLVHRLQLRFYPEQLRCVQYRSVEMDVDAENKQLANLHVNLGATQVNLAGQGNLRRNVLASLDSRRNQLFE